MSIPRGGMIGWIGWTESQFWSCLVSGEGDDDEVGFKSDDFRIKGIDSFRSNEEFLVKFWSIKVFLVEDEVVKVVELKLREQELDEW